MGLGAAGLTLGLLEGAFGGAVAVVSTAVVVVAAPVAIGFVSYQIYKEVESQNARETRSAEKSGSSGGSKRNESSGTYSNSNNNQESRGYGGQNNNDPERQRNRRSSGTNGRGYLSLTELTNVNTTWVLGGTAREIANNIRGIENRGDFEIQHYIPQWILNQLRDNPGRNAQRLHQLLRNEYAIVMLRQHHRGSRESGFDPHCTTGNSYDARQARDETLGILLNGSAHHGLNAGVEGGVMYELYGYAWPFGNLAQYTVGIVQMVRTMLRDGAITVEEYKNILNKLQDLLARESCRLNLRPPEHNESCVEVLFKKLKQMIQDAIINVNA